MMFYLAMMAPRLVELHRVLKETGSLYLHCDPTASHYLRLLLDSIFGGRNFSNEIVWKRTTTKNDYKRGAVNWPRIHDTLLVYHRSTRDARAAKRFNQQFAPYKEENVKTFYSFTDADGRQYRLSDLTAPGQGSRGHPQFEFLGVTRYWRYNKQKLEQLHKEGRIEFRPHGKVPRLKVYLEEAPGIAIGDVWTDVRGMFNFGKQEKMLGYPTQKPVALLERIIAASTNPDDVVLDPFCGCGTTIHAAQKLDRQWIGIDITYLAINLIKRRLKDVFGEEIEFDEKGQPTDFESAKRLAELDKFQFQHWALSLIGARPLREGEGKGADRGVDGLLYFYETERKDIPGRVREEPLPRSEPVHREKIIVQVKGGGVNRGDVATLLGDVENQKAAGGVLITLEKPSKQMRSEAADAGRYTSKLWHDKDYPRIQILTVEGLLNGTERVDAPPQINPFAMAAREATRETQTEML